jgi:uncharacterized protein involved in propanediol utilization
VTGGMRQPITVGDGHGADGGYAVGSAFGTFGELLQGTLPDDQDFLVTMPVSRWSTAKFLLDPHDSGIRVRPRHKHKSERLVRELLAEYQPGSGGRLVIDSDLPEGKGMASSSADLVATARAVGRAIGLEFTPDELESVLRPIEPSDGVMYDGVVAFRHRDVRLHNRFGWLPPLTIVGIDEGGSVDTINFNRIPKPFSAADKREYRRLYDQLRVAIALDDLATIGATATESALLNQRLSPKQTLGRMIAAGKRIGALGVVIAHSGTAVGLLLDDHHPDYLHQLAMARRAGAELAGSVWVDHTLARPAPEVS